MLRAYQRNKDLDFFSLINETGKMLQEKISLAIDIKETKDSFIVYCDLPGVSKEKIDIKIKNGVLTIATKIEQGEKENNAVEGETYRKQERWINKVNKERTIDFGDSVSGEVAAKLENGVLEINLKKTNPDTDEKTIVIE